ncbi:unnamed protein product [Rotaria socialis]|jgi:plasmid replication initiation protein|uniref:Initiator Rep protein WH1 domain-containing protein n=1 Tax=Rotaria socialis TaxID=392032 RepID=A0A817SAZ6_9BILA|nr:unnamed protein product [Rotaria socialis]CAF4513728.1 unnamed protein product [Rotaria socialis]
MKISNDLVVTQSNDLINALYSIETIGEARLMRMLIAQINKDDDDFKTYRISVQDFATVFELEGHSVYEQIEKAAKGLTRCPISIRHNGSWFYANWLSSAKYIHGSGYVELKFDSNLKPFLLQLQDRFTQYGLDYMARIKNPSYIRLYELLKLEQGIEYWKRKSRGTFKKLFEYPDLRELMGIEKNNYKLFSDFVRYVLNQAKKEINASSDIYINEIQIDKKGRAYHYITFVCDESKQMKLDIDDPEPKLIEVESDKKHSEYITQLMAFGIAEKTAYEWKQKYGVARIIRNLGYVTAKKNSGKVKDDLAGYTASAIMKDYGQGWENKAKQAEEKAKIKEEEEENKREAKRLKEEDLNKSILSVISNFEALPDNEKSKFTLDFYETLNNMEKPMLKKHGYSHVSMRLKFARFANEQYKFIDSKSLN